MSYTEFVRATLDDLDPVTELMRRVTATLSTNGIIQWDAQYPSRAFLRDAITDGNLFLLTANGSIVGMVVLDEWQAPQWASVPWSSRDASVLVIHALAVDPSVQGQGYGVALLQHCEHFAQQQGYEALRLDVYAGNPTALRLYEARGYVYCGTVNFPSKPVGHQAYRCYEKALTHEGRHHCLSRQVN